MTVDDRHALAWPHADEIADGNLLDPDLDFAVAPHHVTAASRPST